MAEVVTNVLRLTVGFISDKVRTYASRKLQDGGLTDQKIRSLIVRELDDIKFKHESLSRKDLFASFSFLQEGITFVFLSFESGDPSTSELPKSWSNSAVALANAIGKMTIESSVRFECAKECFREARNAATSAFCNEALHIRDRILASKLRIASGILQHLDDSEVVASDCLLYVQELHRLPAIQEIFSVHFHGGIKSLFRKALRAENVQSVMIMNLFLADFIRKFVNRRMAVFDWPMIECDKLLTVHPIYCEKESLPNLQEKEMTPPWDMVLKDEISSGVLNSEGDLVCFFTGKDDKYGLGKLNTATGEQQLFSSSPSNDIKTEYIEYCCVAVDEDDTVYVLSWYDGVGYKLSVYTNDGIIKYHSELEFLKDLRCCYIAVTKEKKIVICCENDLGEITVYLCDSNVNLVHTFTTGVTNHSIECVFVSCNDEIIVATTNVTKHLHVLYIYTEDGQLQRCVEFHPRNRSSYYMSICYNQVSKNIIGFNVANGKIFVEYLSDETGELQRSYVLIIPEVLENPSSFYLACHRDGALALVSRKHVLFLQTPSKEIMTDLNLIFQ